MSGVDGLPDLGSGDHRCAAAHRRLIWELERGQSQDCPLFILVVAPVEHGKHLAEVVNQVQRLIAGLPVEIGGMAGIAFHVNGQGVGAADGAGELGAVGVQRAHGERGLVAVGPPFAGHPHGRLGGADLHIVVIFPGFVAQHQSVSVEGILACVVRAGLIAAGVVPLAVGEHHHAAVLPESAVGIKGQLNGLTVGMNLTVAQIRAVQIVSEHPASLQRAVHGRGGIEELIGVRCALGLNGVGLDGSGLLRLGDLHRLGGKIVAADPACADVGPAVFPALHPDLLALKQGVQPVIVRARAGADSQTHGGGDIVDLRLNDGLVFIRGEDDPVATVPIEHIAGVRVELRLPVFDCPGGGNAEDGCHAQTYHAQNHQHTHHDEGDGPAGSGGFGFGLGRFVGKAGVLDPPAVHSHGDAEGVDAEGDGRQQTPEQVFAKELAALAVKLQTAAADGGVLGLPAQDHTLGPWRADAQGEQGEQAAQQMPADQAQGAAVEGRLGILRGSVFGNWGVFHKITSFFCIIARKKESGKGN